MKNRFKAGHTKSLPSSLCPIKIRNSKIKNRRACPPKRFAEGASRPVKPSPAKSDQIQPNPTTLPQLCDQIRVYPTKSDQLFSTCSRPVLSRRAVKKSEIKMSLISLYYTFFLCSK